MYKCNKVPYERRVR